MHRLQPRGRSPIISELPPVFSILLISPPLSCLETSTLKAIMKTVNINFYDINIERLPALTREMDGYGWWFEYGYPPWWRRSH